jgi:drug/metabolite transporter (DMT)-like permease
MTVAPAALVAATRETSILFAAFLGWVFLGEKIPPLRALGIVITLAGLVLAKF